MAGGRCGLASDSQRGSGRAGHICRREGAGEPAVSARPEDRAPAAAAAPPTAPSARCSLWAPPPPPPPAAPAATSQTRSRGPPGLRLDPSRAVNGAQDTRRSRQYQPGFKSGLGSRPPGDRAQASAPPHLHLDEMHQPRGRLAKEGPALRAGAQASPRCPWGPQPSPPEAPQRACDPGLGPERSPSGDHAPPGRCRRRRLPGDGHNRPWCRRVLKPPVQGLRLPIPRDPGRTTDSGIPRGKTRGPSTYRRFWRARGNMPFRMEPTQGTPSWCSSASVQPLQPAASREPRSTWTPQPRPE
ncbi:basic proline-rich protein-like [Phacochoerus africanus]|uniref:basic proline-rich protein-like n=1 Tax=Phacochoerus africanus TaxID=41426 RepID=UPI001FD924D8|nr:basic proline-rich protein-like [Phacochoerus africanus]